MAAARRLRRYRSGLLRGACRLPTRRGHRVKAPEATDGGCWFLCDLQAKQRADERTPTADLESPATSDHSDVAGVCKGLEMPHI